MNRAARAVLSLALVAPMAASASPARSKGKVLVVMPGGRLRELPDNKVYATGDAPATAERQ